MILMSPKIQHVHVATVACLLGVVALLGAGCSSQHTSERPNILLIVADDMGYCDLGCFGGEIRTPNLDELASRGVRFTSFCVGPACSPTRAMLLSGCDNHIAGIGNMAEWLAPNQQGKPGYEGHLNDRIAPLPALLRDAGYHTYMAGKWHLGHEPEQFPARFGFERDLSMLDGAGSHWSDMKGLSPMRPKVQYTQDGKMLNQLPADHFSTAAFTDFILDCIKADHDDGMPFFAYVAYQAPHGPYALPDDWLNRCAGRYDAGYDAIRQQRLVREKELGIVPEDAISFPRLPMIPGWEALSPEQKRQSARKMELYAAMVENMDFHVGRMLRTLSDLGELDNTLIIFFSDNGAASEDTAELIGTMLGDEARHWFDQQFDNRFENWGRRGSVVEYGPAWAQVGMVPFRLAKGTQAEGGVRAPLIITGPGVRHPRPIDHQFLHITDVAPTLLEVAGVTAPLSINGRKVEPMQGKSWMPMLSGREETVRGPDDWVGSELFGQSAVRKGDWKLLRVPAKLGGGDWQLYNLASDPAEINDLSAAHPEKLEELLGHWDKYVTRNGVVLPEGRPQPGE